MSVAASLTSKESQSPIACDRQMSHQEHSENDHCMVCTHFRQRCSNCAQRSTAVQIDRCSHTEHCAVHHDNLAIAIATAAQFVLRRHCGLGPIVTVRWLRRR